MDTKTIPDSLEGKLLIAMPGMGDPRFDKSVIYLCSHSPDGAMGLIVNKPTTELEFGDLLKQLDITPRHSIDGIKVFFGGPVEHGRGFVLHSSDYSNADETLSVNDEIGMTASLEILEDISVGEGPDECLLALGYAGWGPGQLEDELRNNGWLLADGNTALVFSKEHAEKWEAAIKSIGIDPRLLSASGGSA